MPKEKRAQSAKKADTPKKSTPISQKKSPEKLLNKHTV